MTNPTARETPDLPVITASTSGTTPSENVLHVLAATPEPAPPCRCEHPFSDHRTPGTECSVIGCDCEPYEPAPAVLDVEHEGPTPRDCPGCLRLHDAPEPAPAVLDEERLRSIRAGVSHALQNADGEVADMLAETLGEIDAALTATPSEATDG